MLLKGYREFTVLYFTSELVRGAKFTHQEGVWKLVAHATCHLDSDNSDENWKSLLKEIGSTSTELLLLSGTLTRGLFFQMSSLPLPPKEQRGAVTMELPRQILAIPDNPLFQFAENREGDNSLLNVYIFPGSSLESLTNHMIATGVRADEFCYPLLGLKPDDEALFMADLEKNYYFYQKSWHIVAGNEAKLEKAKKWWIDTFKSEFLLPNDFNLIEEFTGVLLCARLAISNSIIQQRSNLRVLPEKLRPIRYRRHLAVSAILLILLAVSSIWQANRTWGADYREYRTIVSQSRSLQSKTESMRKRMRKLNKEHKELLRVTQLQNETVDVLNHLALLSKTLPSNVVINRLRLSESVWDINMQSEDERLNLPSLINPLGIWKIEQLQQRQFGDSAVANISFKLTPLKNSSPEKKRK